MTATTLIEKVLTAAKESGYVRKASSHAMGYKYADDEAITTKFRDAMIAQGVLVYPGAMEFHDIQVFHAEDKTPSVLVSIRGALTVTDGTSTLDVASLGQGIDKGDKAIYKAMTGFKKYGYRHLVMMATGDDPEATREDEKPAASNNQSAQRTTTAPVASENVPELTASKEQRDELLALAEKSGVTKADLSLLRKSHTDKLKSSQFTVSDIAAMTKAITELGAVKAAAGDGAAVVA